MNYFLTEMSDVSADDVIRWTYFLNKEFYKNVQRVNVDSFKLTNSDNSFYSLTINLDDKNEKIDLNLNSMQIKHDTEISIWYRRSKLPKLKFFEIDLEKDIGKKLSTHINGRLNLDIKVINDFIESSIQLKSKKSLGNTNVISVNKLQMLQSAKKAGLKIPSTLVTTNKRDIVQFINKHPEIICKAISEGVFGFDSDLNMCANQLTSKLTIDDINNLQEDFAPILIQEKLIKQYELRVCYIEGHIFPMAIFSQNDKQTELDFRHYNSLKPNRNVPYKLPKSIEMAITKFMRIINSNFGQIDLVKTKSGEYVFLEINPVGQFKMTSYPCNYQIEKLIAQYFINQNES